MTVFLNHAPTGFDFSRYLHGWDAYHYYIGSKYFRELGHYELYDCTLIADAEAGLARAPRTALRDLRTNEIKPAAEVLRHRSACKERFTPERWREFSDDVGFFRRRIPRDKWFSLRTDHGYNPPPTWGLLGTPLTNLAPASKAQLTALLVLDPLLIAALSAAIAWAFGWRVMCVAFLFLGNNFPASWDWTGGCILRYDWLFAAVTGICLLRRQRPAAAGALLTWAAALRIFPALILATVGLRRMVQMIAERRLALAPGDLRLALGSLAAAVAIFLGASAVAGGFGPWAEFVEKSRIHLATPLANHAGLRSVLAYDHDLREAVVVDRKGPGDPYVRWREGRRDTFAARAPLFPVLVAGVPGAVGRRGPTPARLGRSRARRRSDRGRVRADQLLPRHPARLRLPLADAGRRRDRAARFRGLLAARRQPRARAGRDPAVDEPRDAGARRRHDRGVRSPRAGGARGERPRGLRPRAG